MTAALAIGVAALAPGAAADDFKVRAVGTELMASKPGPPPPSPGPVTYEGPCPVKITFSGRIAVEGVEKTHLQGKPLPAVKYRFVRSDGGAGPERTMTFQPVQWDNVDAKLVPVQTWTLGGPSLPHYKGWMAIKILAPNPMESEKANFEVTCVGGRKIDPPKAGGGDRPTNPGTIKGFNPQPEPPARKVQ
jgi:hypothetical protein